MKVYIVFHEPDDYECNSEVAKVFTSREKADDCVHLLSLARWQAHSKMRTYKTAVIRARARRKFMRDFEFEYTVEEHEVSDE